MTITINKEDSKRLLECLGLPDARRIFGEIAADDVSRRDAATRFHVMRFLSMPVLSREDIDERFEDDAPSTILSNVTFDPESQGAVECGWEDPEVGDVVVGTFKRCVRVYSAAAAKRIRSAAEDAVYAKSDGTVAMDFMAWMKAANSHPAYWKYMLYASVLIAIGLMNHEDQP